MLLLLLFFVIFNFVIQMLKEIIHRPKCFDWIWFNLQMSQCLLLDVMGDGLKLNKNLDFIIVIQNVPKKLKVKPQCNFN